MEEYDHESLSFYCTNTHRIGRIDTRTRKMPERIGYSLPKPRIVFNINCKNMESYWARAQDSARLELSHAHVPTFLSIPAIDLTREQLCCTELSIEIMNERTEDWIRDETVRRQLIQWSLMRAREALLSMPEGHDSLFLYIPLVLEHRHIYLESVSDPICRFEMPKKL